MAVVGHPTVCVGEGKHLGELVHPMPVAVSGQPPKRRDREFDVIPVDHPTETVPLERGSDRTSVESRDFYVEPTEIVGVVKRHGLVNRYAYEHHFAPGGPASVPVMTREP